MDNCLACATFEAGDDGFCSLCGPSDLPTRQIRLRLPEELHGPRARPGGGTSPRSQANTLIRERLADWTDRGCPPVLPEMPPADPVPDGDYTNLALPEATCFALSAEAERTGRTRSEILRRVVWPNWERP